MKRLLLALLLTGAVTAKAQTAAFDYNEMDCGPELTTFRCLAPAQAKSVVVRLYQDAEGGKALKTVKMKKTAGTDDNGFAVWQTAVKGNLLGRYYTFDSGEGETAGVFAKAVGTKGQRAAIVNMVNTFPDDWCCDQKPVIKNATDLVVYELQPTKDAWTVDELKTLGVNAVLILQPNDPQNLNVPNEGYATNPSDPASRAKDFKTMVQTLHTAGIAVILDLNYDETCTQPFIVESAKHWVDEYRVDGFRFHLAGSDDGTLTAVRQALAETAPDLFIYGTSWDVAQGGFLKGEGGDEERMKSGLAGTIEQLSQEPTQTMAFVSCHDGMSQEERVLAQTAVLTSQGVPFLLERKPQPTTYYQNLIALRKHHPAFRLGDAYLVRKHMEFMPAPDGVVAFRLKGYAGRDDWRTIVVILNGTSERQTVSLPKGMYTIVCQDGEINEASTSKLFGRRVGVSPMSALILHE